MLPLLELAFIVVASVGMSIWALRVSHGRVIHLGAAQLACVVYLLILLGVATGASSGDEISPGLSLLLKLLSVVAIMMIPFFIAGFVAIWRRGVGYRYIGMQLMVVSVLTLWWFGTAWPENLSPPSEVLPEERLQEPMAGPSFGESKRADEIDEIGEDDE